MKEKKNVQINSNILVGAGKSSRLADLSNKVTQKKFTDMTSKTNSRFVSGLKPETEMALHQAVELIEERISLVMNNYPMGKKHSFFKLRHGIDIEKTKQMALKDVFALLRLETAKIQQFRLIEKLDSFGNSVLN